MLALPRCFCGRGRRAGASDAPPERSGSPLAVSTDTAEVKTWLQQVVMSQGGLHVPPGGG